MHPGAAASLNSGGKQGTSLNHFHSEEMAARFILQYNERIPSSAISFPHQHSSHIEFSMKTRGGEQALSIQHCCCTRSTHFNKVWGGGENSGRHLLNKAKDTQHQFLEMKNMLQSHLTGLWGGGGGEKALLLLLTTESFFRNRSLPYPVTKITFSTISFQCTIWTSAKEKLYFAKQNKSKSFWKHKNVQNTKSAK